MKKVFFPFVVLCCLYSTGVSALEYGECHETTRIQDTLICAFTGSSARVTVYQGTDSGKKENLGKTQRYLFFDENFFFPDQLRSVLYESNEENMEGIEVTASCGNLQFITLQTKDGDDWKELKNGYCVCPAGQGMANDKQCYPLKNIPDINKRFPPPSTFPPSSGQKPVTPSGETPGNMDAATARTLSQSMRTVPMGTSSGTIKNLQNFLSKKGYFLFPVTGQMNLSTLGALRKYQYTLGLPQTGRVDLRIQQYIYRDLLLLPPF